MTTVPIEHRIFGTRVVLDLPNDETLKALRQELSLYPAPDGNERLELRIELGPLPPERLAATPSSHGELKAGFFMLGTQADVALQKVNPSPVATLDLKPEKRIWRAKARNLQFTTRSEMAGQILHELVLQPSLYFYPQQLCPIHAAAVATPNGNAFLLGGTGGVGKTSLELEFCMNRGCEFIADDISVMNAQGNVLPNLNLPKIYGYNLQDNPALSRRIFEGRSVVDRLQFELRARKGLGKVRRRVSPDHLYPRVAREARSLTDYFLLARTDSRETSIEALAHETAVGLILDILATEMHVFQRHLRWHRFNCLTRGQAPIIDIDEVCGSWRSLLSRVLATRRCHIVRIPRTMPHRQFRTSVADQILKRVQSG